MKRLDCGHEYHGACLDTWVESGGVSCPMCRNQFISNYRLTLIIENLQTGRQVRQVETVQETIQNILHMLELDHEPMTFTSAEITFPTSNLETVQTTIRDFGFNVDASITNAE